MKMEQRIVRMLCTLIIFALISDTTVTIQFRDSNNKRRPKEKGGFYKNICDITDRDSKVHCYCENTREPRNATKAECWVFNGGIRRNDDIWESFASQPSLQTLSFNVRVDGALDYVPNKALQYLQRLRSINIKYGNIVEVKSYSFANLTSMKEAILSQNQIEHLQQYAFVHLPNLTVVNFEENMILEIVRDSFIDVPNLKKLIFTNNNISSISNGAFKHAFNLVELDLDKNNIFILNRHTFDGLANLNKLDLRRNRIYNLTEFTFAELWNLEELNLGKNHINFVSERAFDGLSQLQKLCLDYNKLTSLPSGLFEGVRGLRSLDLRSNKIQTLALDNIKPILDNLKPLGSDMLLEENNFICDCTLKWMHTLRNETRSQSIKDSLESVTCIINQPIISSTFNQLPDYKVDMVAPKMSIDYKINITNSEIEDIKDVAKDFYSRRPARRNLLQIPPETLPCFIETKTTAEMPRMIDHVISIQKEIKTLRFQEVNFARKNSVFYYLLSWSVGFAYFIT